MFGNNRTVLSVRRSMRTVILPFILAAFPTVAAAGPPPQLYGKSISLAWSEDMEQQLVSGQKKHMIADAAFGIYVSDNGRIFTRSSRAGRARHPVQRPGYTLGRSHDPTGDIIKTTNSRYHYQLEFHGRTL